MKKKRRIIVGILAAGIFSLAFTGCTTFDNFKEAFINKDAQQDDTIRIGVYEPMSGADKEGGELETQGIELANQLYPTVLGKKVELVYADNRSDIDAAETAMADLMKKQPSVVLGSYGSIYSLVANGHIEAAQTPAIAITNTNPLVTKNHPYYFRVCFVDTYQAVALARYVVEHLQQTNAGIMLPEGDDQAMAMASTFKEKMTELTGDSDAIAVYQKFTPKDEDFSQQLQAIASSGIGTVFLVGDAGDSANILKQASEMGISQVTFLGSNGWAEDEFIKDAGKYVSGNIAFSTLYTEDEAVTATSRELSDAYAKKYGEEETLAAATALGFDAYLVTLQAIEEAGDGASGSQIRDALATTKNFQGASGDITFDNYGDPQKSVVINTMINQKISPICTIEPYETKSAQQSEKTKSTQKKEKSDNKGKNKKEKEKKNGTED